MIHKHISNLLSNIYFEETIRNSIQVYIRFKQIIF